MNPYQSNTLYPAIAKFCNKMVNDPCNAGMSNFGMLLVVDLLTTPEQLSCNEHVRKSVGLLTPGTLFARTPELEKMTINEENLTNFDYVRCGICKKKAVIGDEITHLLCSHMFHRICIVPWMYKSGVCPKCSKLSFTPSPPPPFTSAIKISMWKKLLTNFNFYLFMQLLVVVIYVKGQCQRFT